MRWGSYITLLIILFIDFIGMIILTSRSTQFFIFQLFLIILFILLALIFMTGIVKNRSWAWKVASLYFLLFLIILSFTYLNSRGILVFGGSSVLAAIGFLISVSNIRTEPELPLPPPPEELEPVEVVPYGEKKEKFIAGKTGKAYYRVGSKEAKRIKNPVYFRTEQEAKKQGYKKHKSV
jgi:hypothetical protein